MKLIVLAFVVAAASLPVAVYAEGAGGAKTVRVDVTVQFREGDRSITWADALILTRAGERPDPGAQYLLRIAARDGKRWLIRSSFELVPIGQVYDVWADTGFDKRRVGQVDLRKATGDVTLNFHLAPRKPTAQ